MTTEDQDAIVGRLVRERRDLRAQREAVSVSLQKLGDLLSGMGHILRVKPEVQQLPDRPVLRIDQNGAVTVSNEYRPHEMVSGQYPTHEQISRLLAEQQDIVSRLSELDTQLKTFGI